MLKKCLVLCLFIILLFTITTCSGQWAKPSVTYTGEITTDDNTDGEYFYDSYFIWAGKKITVTVESLDGEYIRYNAWKLGVEGSIEGYEFSNVTDAIGEETLYGYQRNLKFNVLDLIDDVEDRGPIRYKISFERN
ncbi:MAG: hypothetical protein MJB14_10550 [Spirochaetes bacterium]|nr:hypothetical protein [Spirochaetota bacterium]